MIAGTHYAFSCLLCTASGFDYQTTLVASLVSLLPDIDHPASLIGRIFSGPSKYILRKYGHRTVTHSVFAVLAAALLFSPALFFNLALYFAVLLAFSSHIFLDIFNVGGVKLFAPVSQKEYISFHSPGLRILVSSWKEYVLLFLIVLSAFMLSGQDFSMHKAVRFVSKYFYKTYDAAIVDFQENSKYQCIAKVSHFDHAGRKKVEEEFPVLNLFLEKAYLLKDGNRIIIKKADIDEIEIESTVKPISVEVIDGKDFSKLSAIPAGSFISGTVKVNVCPLEIKNSDYVKVEKGLNEITFYLTYATPDELSEIISIDKARKDEIEKLQSKLYSHQIDLLRKEETSLKSRLSVLRRKGFYANYASITSVNNELKKVRSKIESLKLSVSAGADQDTLREIEKLDRGFKVEYKLYMYRM
ncbi:MAG: metal-dependent hydrolase [Spirochaetota bacterium]